MLTTIRKRLNSEEGFTLVELLVVILIIGILAAIAIPSFLNQKGKGEDAAAKSAAREASTAMETYYTDKGDYAGATVALLQGIEGTLPAGPSGAGSDATATGFLAANGGGLTVVSTANDYTVRVWSKPSGRMYSITKATTGTVTRGCAIEGAGKNAGGCKLAVPGTDTTGTW